MFEPRTNMHRIHVDHRRIKHPFIQLYSPSTGVDNETQRIKCTVAIGIASLHGSRGVAPRAATRGAVNLFNHRLIASASHLWLMTHCPLANPMVILLCEASGELHLIRLKVWCYFYLCKMPVVILIGWRLCEDSVRCLPYCVVMLHSCVWSAPD